ncbi:MBL fold metallo-hydrolase [Actimicrobium sp. CCI2.3]|uniref:MBL fold metallo-hydrolase n=1 Tax=Actimicrobium sp. CCI2.3 TaxID=3048616 RepID=UPI002AB522EB|nr:MBL fold metallo-hydrolase [Actimicrobium sp. CCI2.3]MDY7575163.1 MBL fold metallo-hydrolase [Actimicrobium sp. CCI2.3]MEB0023585.1 MBL fold metallo-hydrolase [Actimicrobium sp. CCI2.3]
MDNTLKRFLILGLALMCAVALGTGGYLYLTLGQLPDNAQLQGAPQYRDGQFQNEVASPPRSGGFGFILAVIRGRFEPRDRPAPAGPLPSVKTNLAALDPGQDIVIWLGHSSYFVQVGGKRLLIDPVFSNYAAPVPGMVRAFEGTSLYTAEDMPEIDVVLITHDHYDHLDYASMKALEPKTRLVIAGLGNGAHLRHWGYPEEKIREMNWHGSLELGDGLMVHALPAQHYSGRFLKRNQSLWVSYALETAERRLYFSGDTGFGPHFAQIAKRFDRFDFVSLDAGQYNQKWADIHMTPEEASRAADILNADSLLTGHAGRFSLARHAWDEPFERALAASKGKSYRLLTPRIGEPVHLQDRDQAFTLWWKGLK